MTDFVYLASQSPRRAQLLAQLGVRYELLLADQHEDAEALEVVLPHEAPATYVKRVTALKLAAAVVRRVRRKLPDAPVLCSDTTVALGRRIYGKPADADEARDMLSALSGRTHRVLTAVAVQPCDPDALQLETTSESRVSFAVMSPAQIAGYVDTRWERRVRMPCREGQQCIYVRSAGATVASWDCRCMKLPSCYAPQA